MNTRIRKFTFLLLLLFVVISGDVFAAKLSWVDSVEVSAGTIISSKHEIPLWLWANQDGRVPREGNSSFTRLRFGKKADEGKQFDWMYGFDATLRSSGVEPQTRWTDGWLGLTYKKVCLTAGRRSEIVGLADPLLTAGPEVYSRNAPTIPKIAISTNGYVDLTNTLSVNAYLAHGWFGTDPYTSSPWLHEKYLFFRLGDTRPDNGVNLYVGIHDTAIWGGSGQPASPIDYFRIFFARPGGSDASISDRINGLGDHRGTLETAVQFKGADRDWYFYAMSMYEDRSGLAFWDPGDWFTGASVIFKDPDSRLARINIEYLDTRQSSGPDWEPDNYFTGQYGGWVHEGYTIGTPFVPFVQGQNNTWSPLNRIKAVNGAVLARFSPLMNPLFRLAWIHVSGSFNDGLFPVDQRKTIVAMNIENTMYLTRSWSLLQDVSADFNNEAAPSWGAMFSISKSWF